MEFFVKPRYMVTRISRILAKYDTKAAKRYEDLSELRRSIEGEACYKAYTASLD